jgi:hypothetical protein
MMQRCDGKEVYSNHFTLKNGIKRATLSFLDVYTRFLDICGKMLAKG